MTSTVTIAIGRDQADQISGWRRLRLASQCPGCRVYWHATRGYDHAENCSLVAVSEAAEAALLTPATDEHPPWAERVERLEKRLETLNGAFLETLMTPISNKIIERVADAEERLARLEGQERKIAALLVDVTRIIERGEGLNQ